MSNYTKDWLAYSLPGQFLTQNVTEKNIMVPTHQNIKIHQGSQDRDDLVYVMH